MGANMQKTKIDIIFENCYEEHSSYIRRYCCYKLNDYPDLAEDCVQDTFRIFYEKLKSGYEIHNPKAFLIKIASNFVKVKLTEIGRSKYRNISIDECGINLSYNENFFEEASEELIIDIKEDILSSLNEEEKVLLSETCKNYKDSYKTTKELAKKYNCSETNIRQRIFVLRNKIRKIIKEKTKDL